MEYGTGPITSLMGKKHPTSDQAAAPVRRARPRRPVAPHPGVQSAQLMDVCQRIYHRDRPRFAKLVVWVHTMRKRTYDDRYILQTLTILDKREAEGKPIAEWWPWCDRAIQYLRTRDKQSESQRYKKADFSSARAIMKELFKNL